MSDDASSKGARKLPMVDGNSLEIREDSRAPQFVDFICESTTLNGTLYVSLGSLVQDLGNPPLVDIACRLRMNVVTAQNLHSALGQLIEAALKPADMTKAN